MKRILIIMGNHSPEPSSVANCAEPLINKLVNSGFEIDIVTNRKNTDIPRWELKNEINIYRIDDVRFISSKILDELKQVDSTRVLKVLTQFFIFILKACYHIRFDIFTKEKQTSGWQEKTVIRKCIELHRKHKYDAVISISLPFKSHHMAKKLIQQINEPVKWFMFEFDPFSYNGEITKNLVKRKILFDDEYNMFQKCDNIFLTPELYKFYKKTPLSIFSGKFVSVPFANMQPIAYKNDEDININFDSKRINCIFTGRLYKNIRNPDYALQLFSQLNRDIHFILLTDFSRETIGQSIPNLIDEDFEYKISVYPLQKRDIALQALMKSDILINIGNTVEFQIPGKIFEYIGTGKPIVHFSKFPEDPALVYLEKYPNVLIIKEWECNIKKHAAQLEVFCNNYKGINLSYEEVCIALDGLDGESVSKRFVDRIAALLKEK